MLRLFLFYLLGRPDLVKRVADLEHQIEGLQGQVRHAALATNDMGAHSREAEVAIHRIRLAFSEERRRNVARMKAAGLQYEIIPEDFALTGGTSRMQFHPPSQPKRLPA